MFIKHSKENIEEDFCVLEVGEDFLYRIQKAITTNEKNIKKFILIKATSQKASYHVKKMNMQTTYWEEIFIWQRTCIQYM